MLLGCLCCRRCVVHVEVVVVVQWWGRGPIKEVFLQSPDVADAAAAAAVSWER